MLLGASCSAARQGLSAPHPAWRSTSAAVLCPPAPRQQASRRLGAARRPPPVAAAAGEAQPGSGSATARPPAPPARKFVFAVDGKPECEEALRWAVGNIFSKGERGTREPAAWPGALRRPTCLPAGRVCASKPKPNQRAPALHPPGDKVYLAHCLSDPRTPATAVGSSSAATQWSPARDEQRCACGGAARAREPRRGA